GVPEVAFAAQTTPAATPATTPPAQATDSANAKKKADKKKGNDANNPANLAAVIVTGYRQSIDQNLQDKRYSNSIVEVINAQNISQFPAKNIADALAHVPGVVITRESGEGKTVSIRGLAPELTLTELNGNYVASADTSSGLTRSFN
ncbi:TonB-dependent receptor plug domain-containing protein, partial [Staphylococcus aureus]